jgi:hypothetical protein
MANLWTSNCFSIVMVLVQLGGNTQGFPFRATSEALDGDRKKDNRLNFNSVPFPDQRSFGTPSPPPPEANRCSVIRHSSNVRQF